MVMMDHRMLDTSSSHTPLVILMMLLWEHRRCWSSLALPPRSTWGSWLRQSASLYRWLHKRPDKSCNQIGCHDQGSSLSRHHFIVKFLDASWCDGCQGFNLYLLGEVLNSDDKELDIIVAPRKGPMTLIPLCSRGHIKEMAWSPIGHKLDLWPIHWHPWQLWTSSLVFWNFFGW
jgi:hypothetical protein